MHILRTPSPKNTSGGLLLEFRILSNICDRALLRSLVLLEPKLCELLGYTACET